MSVYLQLIKLYMYIYIKISISKSKVNEMYSMYIIELNNRNFFDWSVYRFDFVGNDYHVRVESSSEHAHQTKRRQ